VPYLVESGDTLAHSRGTHDVLRRFSADVRRAAPRAFTIGEGWDSTGTILSYYPNELDAHFAFPVSEAILDAVRTGKAGKLLPEVQRFQRALPPDRWSPFLRNHDQTRTLTALGGDTARARLAAEILFTLPGLPFVYYGEEIGMSGDKPDERLRTPMQWTAGASGFTSGKPWEALQADTMTTNVARQSVDSGSLLNVYRRLIHLRASNAALAAGELIPLATNNDGALAYLRRDGSRAVLVIANLGTTPITGLEVSSTAGALPAGRYATTVLYGGGGAGALQVGADGGLVKYAASPTLGRMQTHIIELSPLRR
jgi:glycosidase